MPFDSCLHNILEKIPKPVLMGITICSIVIIGIVDSVMPTEARLFILYLAPIGIGAWYVQRSAGLLLANLSTLTGFLSDTIQHDRQHFLSWVPYWNFIARGSLFILVAHLLSALKQAYEREKYLARTDPLTGAINRRFFLELLEMEVRRCQRYGRPLTLAYIDIDDFKLLNTRFGHAGGDRVLCEIVTTGTLYLRTTDCLARLGGDEFAILLPELSYAAAQIAIARIHQELTLRMQTLGIPASFSVGAVTFVTFSDSLDTMLDRADRLMYAVKQKGKNRVEYELCDRQ